jgi:hypothetical protein
LSIGTVQSFFSRHPLPIHSATWHNCSWATVLCSVYKNFPDQERTRCLGNCNDLFPLSALSVELANKTKLKS